MDYDATFGRLLEPMRKDLRNDIHERNQAALDDCGPLLALARNAAAETVHLDIATRLIATNNRARASLMAVMSAPVQIMPPALPEDPLQKQRRIAAVADCIEQEIRDTER